tara:strand:+ start:284 stop:466 length:183 start_codon:yes stop_codon:yes gene_type:complete
MIEIIVLALLIGILITLYRVGKKLDDYEKRISYMESINTDELLHGSNINPDDLRKLLEKN